MKLRHLEAGGARDFWTFAADGTFFGTTSTQPLFNFSNQQGSWRKVGGAGAKGVLLAFGPDALDVPRSFTDTFTGRRVTA